MKYLKLFEDYNKSVITSDELIDIVYDIHRDPDDFYDTEDFSGLQTIINKYDLYSLKDININDIPKQHTNYSKDRVMDYIEMYKRNVNYPPIVYDSDLGLIIDGIHRFEALKRLGEKTILAFVGLK